MGHNRCNKNNICWFNFKTNKNNFTRVLKGHIAVATCNLGKYNSGYLIDKQARKPLNEENLDYQHGTGHGVVSF